MASRRLLASVAEGTARSFASRNNDVGGWWALGLLLDALPAGDPDYRLDLLAGTAEPEAPGPLGLLAPAWRDYFAWSLRRHDVDPGAVRSAVLTVCFDRKRPVTSHLPQRDDEALDRHFAVRVEVEDDRRRVRLAVAEGHCGPQSGFTDPDPSRRPRQSADGQGEPRARVPGLPAKR
jgi:hypothetical protein